MRTWTFWDGMKPGRRYYWPLLRGDVLYPSHFMVNSSGDHYHIKGDFGTTGFTTPPKHLAVTVMIDTDNRNIIKQSANGLVAGIPNDNSVLITFIPQWTTVGSLYDMRPAVSLNAGKMIRTSIWAGSFFPTLFGAEETSDIEAYTELAKAVTAPRGRRRYQ